MLSRSFGPDPSLLLPRPQRLRRPTHGWKPTPVMPPRLRSWPLHPALVGETGLEPVTPCV